VCDVWSGVQLCVMWSEVVCDLWIGVWRAVWFGMK
jgi:hypothetical protein